MEVIIFCDDDARMRGTQDWAQWEKMLIRIFEGKTPRMHPAAFISEAAYILGNVAVGEYSSVWPGVVIRGDYGRIIMGRHTNTQDDCLLDTDDYVEIGDGVVVTHGGVLDCRKVDR